MMAMFEGVNEAESRALADVQARLAERFPDVDAETIEAAVRLSHSELVGPVRAFVPVLVEHSARDRIAAFAPAESALPGE
jgi:hypothetical protein